MISRTVAGFRSSRRLHNNGRVTQDLDVTDFNFNDRQRL